MAATNLRRPRTWQTAKQNCSQRHPSKSGLTWRWMAYSLLVGIGGLGLVWYFYPIRCAQIGRDKAVLSTVDAMFTAVTGRNNVQLVRCQTELEQLRKRGQLPAEAAKSLAQFADQAQHGDWHGAAVRLNQFIKGQSGGPTSARKS